MKTLEFKRKERNTPVISSLTSHGTVNSVHNRLLEYAHFLELVQYERIRSDRLGDVFSLVIIKGTEKEFNLLEVGMIKNIIQPQLRSTDYMGWYGKNSLALLLPLTDYTESDLLMTRIKAQILGMGILTSTTCHSYPENWFTRKVNQGNLSYTPWNPTYKENEVGIKVSRPMPFWKRTMDITLSVILLTLLSPLLLLVSLYIKIVSPGPVFFVQNRVGHRGKVFKFYKFRSMHCSNNEALHGKHAQTFIHAGDIPMIKLDTNDPRIIRGCGILRSSCIDELPQLFNVLKGDMSLVGPRPCIEYEAEEYLRWHTHRFDTVPGITGLWQVSGKNDLSFKEMVRLDIHYSKNISLMNDIKILLNTFPTILKLIGQHIYSRSAVDPTPNKIV